MRVKLPTALTSSVLRPHISPTPPYTLLQACSPCSIVVPTTDPPLPSYRRHPIRTLTSTSPFSKKGGKQDSKRTVPLNAAKTSGLDPFDFSDFQAAISRAHERLKTDLSRIKAGGRDPEVVENVRVRLGKGEGRSEREMVRVGDLASVVPRGRNVAVLVGEKDHIKPILSALASSENLNPTTSPTDPLTILVPIPPTTQESREAAKTLASKKGDEALVALREARGAEKKRLRAMELGKQVGPDDSRRAEREMEKINERAMGEAKKLVEGARRGLEGG